jgi:hypothetical protein
MMFLNLYAEDIDDYEDRCRKRWIEEAAYFRWNNSGRLPGFALDHWLESAQEYDALEQRGGMPPYMTARIGPNYAIAHDLVRLGSHQLRIRHKSDTAWEILSPFGRTPLPCGVGRELKNMR